MLLILPAFTKRPSLVTGCHSFSSFLPPPRAAKPPPRGALVPRSAIFAIVRVPRQVLLLSGGVVDRCGSGRRAVFFKVGELFAAKFGFPGVVPSGNPKSFCGPGIPGQKSRWSA